MLEIVNCGFEVCKDTVGKKWNDQDIVKMLGDDSVVIDLCCY